MDKELILIGVGHIFNIKNKISTIIEMERPDAIAVELDRRRLQALENQVKRKGIDIYSLLSLAQASMAKKFGTQAGSEMIGVIKKSQELNIPYYLIDMDSFYVINKIWRKIGLIDKIKLFFSILISFFIRKKKIEEEIKRMDENITDEIGKYFPVIKEILIDERNRYMVKNVLNLLEKHDKIIVVVGEGHIPGMENMLKNYAKVKTIHLKDYLEI